MVSSTFRRVPMCVPNKFIACHRADPDERLRDRSAALGRLLIWIQFIVLHSFMEILHLVQFKCNWIGGASRWNVVRWVDECRSCHRRSATTPSVNNSHADVSTRFIFMIAIILTSDANTNWSETAQQLTRISSCAVFFCPAARSLKWLHDQFHGRFGWHKNELCRIIFLSWLIHFINCEGFRTREMSLKVNANGLLLWIVMEGNVKRCWDFYRFLMLWI